MPYSKFTMKRLKNEFNIEDFEENFLNSKPIEISKYLKYQLAMANKLTPNSEKARNELYVMPILLELVSRNPNISVLSGENLDVDIDKDLNGELDFLITNSPITTRVKAPIFNVIEAKKEDLKKGIPQCIAQMIGAKLFNKEDGNDINTIYGAVTTGEIWLFLKLEDNKVTIEKRRFYINKVEEIIGALQEIVDFYK